MGEASPVAEWAEDVDMLRKHLSRAHNNAAPAAWLHISRPAFYTRLACIAMLLGVVLDDAESMMSLLVALIVFDARQRTEPVSAQSAAGLVIGRLVAGTARL